jgi:lysophospholipase L1-like esterase
VSAGSRRGSKRFFLAGLSAAAALAGAEWFVRARGLNDADTTPEAELHTPLVQAYMRPSADPELGFELQPGVDISWRHTRVRIHPRESRRVAPAAEDEDPLTLRLGVLGDSTAFGWGVEFEASYPERVRRALAERTGRCVVLRNFATPGFNSRQNRRTFETRVREWRPELLIVHYDHNDTAPNARPEADELTSVYGDNVLGSALLELVLQRLRAHELVARSTRATEVNPTILGFRYSGPEYERSLAELAELARQAREVGIVPLLLVFNAGLVLERADVPWPSDPAELARLQAADARAFAQLARSIGFRKLLHEPLEARAAATGFEVLDTYAPAQARMQAHGWQSLRPLWLSKTDNHPNPEGHAFLAELVNAALFTRPAYAALTRPSAR